MPEYSDSADTFQELLDALAAHLPNLPDRVRRAYQSYLGSPTADHNACKCWREAARICDGIPLEILKDMRTGSAGEILNHLTAPGGELSRRWREYLNRKK